MIIIAPFPPSVNRAYRVFSDRLILSKEGREYIAMFKQNVTRMSGMWPPFTFFKEKRLRVCYNFYPPDNRRRDLANLDKVLSDCFTKTGVWEDDSCIDDIRFVRKHTDRANPRVEVTIDELTLEPLVEPLTYTSNKEIKP